MQNKFIYAFMGFVIAIATTHATYKHVIQPLLVISETAPRIAKVGATGIKGIYNHSIKAFDAQYAKGFRHFIVNLNMTSDGQVVCVGSWQTVAPKLFKDQPTSPFTFEQFRQAKTINSERPCHFKELTQWMLQHNDASLLLSLAAPTASILQAITDQAGTALPRLSVVVATNEEARIARSVGIKTIYWLHSGVSDSQNNEIAMKYVDSIQPFAVIFQTNSLPNGQALIESITEKAISVYANPVNDCDTLKQALKMGVSGISTDSLSPEFCK